MLQERSKSNWVCTNRSAHHVSRKTTYRLDNLLDSLFHRGVGRLRRDSWIRYYRNLDKLPPPPAGIRLHKADDALMDRLRNHPEHDSNQVRSGLRFWERGFRHAYLWLDSDNDPLCMQWIFLPDPANQLAKLGPWSGMYPPLPTYCGQAENIYTFRSGHNMAGGAATRLAQAVFHEARRMGLRELRTHIHRENLPAHRWARRAGWQAFGYIDRYALKLPRLPELYGYLHQACEIRNLSPVHRNK